MVKYVSLAEDPEDYQEMIFINQERVRLTHNVHIAAWITRIWEVKNVGQRTNVQVTININYISISISNYGGEMSDECRTNVGQMSSQMSGQMSTTIPIFQGLSRFDLRNV